MTSIKTRRETLQTFPAITICNLNPFQSGTTTTISYLKKILLSNSLKADISPTEDQYSIFLIRQAMEVLKATSMSNMSYNSSFVQSLGFDMNLMLISCYFNGFFCDESDFYSHYTYDYGFCYIFNHDGGNSSKLRTVTKSGPRSGLELELFVGYSGLPSKKKIQLYYLYSYLGLYFSRKR